MWVTGIPFCRFLLVSEHPGPPATRCCLPDPARNTPGGEASSSMELPKPWGLLPCLASLTLKIYQVNKNTVESQCLAGGLKINDIYYWNDLGAFQLIDGLTDCGVNGEARTRETAKSLGVELAAERESWAKLRTLGYPHHNQSVHQSVGKPQGHSNSRCH